MWVTIVSWWWLLFGSQRSMFDQWPISKNRLSIYIRSFTMVIDRILWENSLNQVYWHVWKTYWSPSLVENTSKKVPSEHNNDYFSTYCTRDVVVTITGLSIHFVIHYGKNCHFLLIQNVMKRPEQDKSTPFKFSGINMICIISVLQLGRVEKGRENLRFSDLRFFYRPVMVNHYWSEYTFRYITGKLSFLTESKFDKTT